MTFPTRAFVTLLIAAFVTLAVADYATGTLVVWQAVAR